MPSLKDLRNRISSVKSTQKITKAMQMVAASKLRRAQEQAEAARPFAERMERMLGSLAAGSDGAEDLPALLRGTGSDEKHLVVVATAERGLCGAFNSAIVRAAQKKIAALLDDGKDVKILCIGKKGHAILRRTYADRIIELIDLSSVRRLSYDDARPIGRKIIDLFHTGQIDVCTVFYSRFKSVISQVPTEQQLIPAVIPEPEEGAEETATSASSYEFEPDEAEILSDLLPRNISVQIFRVLLENAAGEQGARMAAMDNATRNAGEMIDNLTLQYNRTRQAVITTELIEIISGAEAL